MPTLSRAHRLLRSRCSTLRLQLPLTCRYPHLSHTCRHRSLSPFPPPTQLCPPAIQHWRHRTAHPLRFRLHRTTTPRRHTSPACQPTLLCRPSAQATSHLHTPQVRALAMPRRTPRRRQRAAPSSPASPLQRSTSTLAQVLAPTSPSDWQLLLLERVFSSCKNDLMYFIVRANDPANTTKISRR